MSTRGEAWKLFSFALIAITVFSKLIPHNPITTQKWLQYLVWVFGIFSINMFLYAKLYYVQKLARILKGNASVHHRNEIYNDEMGMKTIRTEAILTCLHITMFAFLMTPPTLYVTNDAVQSIPEIISTHFQHELSKCENAVYSLQSKLEKNPNPHSEPIYKSPSFDVLFEYETKYKYLWFTNDIIYLIVWGVAYGFCYLVLLFFFVDTQRLQEYEHRIHKNQEYDANDSLNNIHNLASHFPKPTE